MSGPVMLDRQKLAIALSEVETVRKVLPPSALTALAHEVVRRVAQNLVPTLPYEFLPNDTEIDTLCEALIGQDAQAAITLIEAAQKKGALYEAICQSYLAVASRRLGEWWDEDRISFYKVTIAAGRIYAILRILRLQRPPQTPDLRKYAVFASVPGEDHTLGVTMAADAARQGGWDIDLLTGYNHDELTQVIEGRDVAVIGLSASSKRSLPALMKLIIALRLVKPRARILVCGQIASMNVNLYGLTGADGAAADLDSALEQMERLVDEGLVRPD